MRDALIAELVNRRPKDVKRVSGSVEPVPAKILSFERGTGGTTSELVEEPPEEPATELVRPNETLVMESLLLAGLMSKNKILEHLGGNRKKRLEQLSEIEARLKSEGRLKGEQSNG
jgi:hypothetical protein